MPDNLSAALAAFFASLPQRPQLLALGEPTHGIEAFPRIRNLLFQTLVSDYGFRSIALESDILSGLRVNAYVTGGEGSLDDVMARGFSHGFGQFAANCGLVTWLREFNAGRPEEEQVRFYGFDAPMENMWAASPRHNLLALHTFLTAHLGELPLTVNALEALCGEDQCWINQAAALDAAQSVGGTPEARELRVLADDLRTILRREAPRLRTQPSFWEAELHARTALGLLRYHANMARPDAGRKVPDRLPTMLSLRDLMMADNLQAIAERERERGATLVFAHNLHLQRAVSGMTMAGQRLEWWSAGAHVSAKLDSDYAFIAAGLGISEALGVDEPVPSSIEGRLMELPDSVNLRSRVEVRELIAQPLESRADFPPQAFALNMPLLSGADGLLFIRDTEGSLGTWD